MVSTDGDEDGISYASEQLSDLGDGTGIDMVWADGGGGVVSLGGDKGTKIDLRKGCKNLIVDFCGMRDFQHDV